jgi:hypothetical protein
MVQLNALSAFSWTIVYTNSYNICRQHETSFTAHVYKHTSTLAEKSQMGTSLSIVFVLVASQSGLIMTDS